MMHGYGFHWWGMGLSWIFGLIFLAIIVWFFIRIFTYKGEYYHPHKDKSALDILKERYARGEINKEEFEEKKKGILE